MQPAVAKKVKLGQSTSSPGADPQRHQGEEERVGARAHPQRVLRAGVNWARARSKFSTSGPRMKWPERSTRRKASRSSGSSAPFCALRFEEGDAHS